jgi:hypothetical protein
MRWPERVCNRSAAEDHRIADLIAFLANMDDAQISLLFSFEFAAIGLAHVVPSCLPFLEKDRAGPAVGLRNGDHTGAIAFASDAEGARSGRLPHSRGTGNVAGGVILRSRNLGIGRWRSGD